MAANGNRSVAMQISTVPSWMMVGGTDPDTLPEDPWSYSHWGDYNQGAELVDKSCGELATYIARMVSWCTAVQTLLVSRHFDNELLFESVIDSSSLRPISLRHSSLLCHGCVIVV